MEPLIEVNLNNLISNYKKIKEYTQKNVIAVIKDNAYGHGLLKVAQVLAKSNVTMLCVSAFSEALLLRKNMIFTPILLLGRYDDARSLYSLKITPSISCLNQLEILAKSNIPLPIHLEIETGMHRTGISLDELTKALEIINNSKLILKGVFTHFCIKNNQIQIERFKKALDHIPQQKKLLIHAEASNYIDNNLDFTNTVRVGLALYGYNQTLQLNPCLSLKIPVVKCEKVSKDTPIGYNHNEKTKEDGYIITTPFGYSNGLSRLEKLCLFHNNFIYQIGDKCMDMSMFFSLNPIKETTFLELIGTNNIFHLLELNNDSIYYALSSLSTTIKRIYIN